METTTTDSPFAPDTTKAPPVGAFFAHKYNQTVACCRFMGILATANNPLVHFTPIAMGLARRLGIANDKLDATETQKGKSNES